MTPNTYSKDNMQFVVDALEQGWSVRKCGDFYEITNDTTSDHLQVPSLSNARSLSALFEDCPRPTGENVGPPVKDQNGT
jgi:hypothetical protein